MTKSNKKRKSKTRTAPTTTSRGATALALDDEAAIASSSECPGTFRWAEDKVQGFPRLPPFPPAEEGWPVVGRGWGHFLASRGGKPLVAAAQQDAAMLDALSFPATVLRALSALQLQPSTASPLRIVALGAARRAEQRVATATEYFHDLAAWFPGTTVELWFVGPEIGPPSTHHTRAPPPPNMTVRFFQGTLGAFTAQHPDVMPSEPTNTVFVLFNPGFGNFAESNQFELLWSWLPDLIALLATGSPVICTCANDYADVRGEQLVWSQVLRAQHLAAPAKNDLSCATVLLGEGLPPDSPTGWSCGNAWWYAVTGGTAEQRRNRKPLPPSSYPTIERLLTSLVRRVPLDRWSPRLLDPVHTVRLPWGATAPTPTPACTPSPPPPPLPPATPSSTPTQPRTPAPASTPAPATAPTAASAEAPAPAAPSAATPAPATALGPPLRSGGAPAAVDYDLSTTEKEVALVVHTTTEWDVTQAQLDVAAESVMLQWPAGRLEVPMPAPVDAVRSRAKFSKRKGTLTVTMPRQRSY